jgi:hypothetical protein
MTSEPDSVQSYVRVVREFLAAGRREQALVAFAQLMRAHPASAETRALLVELFQGRTVDVSASSVDKPARRVTTDDV